MSESTPTIEFYESAIAQLEAMTQDAPDAETLRGLYTQIARLRHSMIDAAFNDIVQRTPLLQALVAELRAAIASAQGTTLQGAVDGLTTLANQVSDAIGMVRGVAGAVGGSRGLKRAARRVARDIAAAGPALKILCVHGVGDHHTDNSWQGTWIAAILAGLRRWNANATIDPVFELYDDLFDTADLNAGTVAAALWKLGSSGIWHGIGDIFRRPRGLMDVPTELRWTAGMVAQWADDEDLRSEARGRVAAKITAENPSVIAAHSLGSLICYDTFRLMPDLLKGRTFVTFGSQIGNPFVRSTFAGRIEELTKVRKWYHLFNPNDRAFAQELRLTSESFVQVNAEFTEGIINHDAIRYLTHPNVVRTLWYDLATSTAPQAAVTPGARAIDRTNQAFHVVSRKPDRRALLIGINQYPDPDNRLEGCINDVFKVSAALQESGFKPEDIRTVFDDRATTSGILDRLHWLLDDVCSGNIRFLYYSGHGAQIPSYGAYDKVDHFNECLVPYDFDWSPEKAVMDRQFFDFYSQLPYGSHFIAMFDCCHSGGLTRGGAHRVRGISPPDDVRHRMLRWNPADQMWEERDLSKTNQDMEEKQKIPPVAQVPVQQRLGDADLLRLPGKKQNDRRAEYDHEGPYKPVLFQACDANELSYEYRDGVTSYGAFTFALTTALRIARDKGETITWNDLLARTSKALKGEYLQSPCLRGPKAVLSDYIPWLTNGTSKGGKKKKKG